MKKSSDEILPLNLPFELCEIIFNLMISDDLLKCFLVSKIWRNFIQRSKSFHKVVLTINQELELESVLASSRKFTNIQLKRLDGEKFVSCLIEFPTVKKLLIIECCAIETEKKINLNNLEELTISNVSEKVLHPLTSFHENLKILNLHHLTLCDGSIVNFIKLNKNLKEISLYLNQSCNLFDHDIAVDFQSSLESVTISFRSDFDIDAHTLANVEKFLMSQGETLKNVCLINSASLSAIYRVWNFMRVVKRFYFFTGDPFLDAGSKRPALQPKESLEALEIHVLGPLPMSLEDLRPLLTSARKLKSLGVWNLKKDLLEYSATHLMTLRSLFCATIGDDCELYFEQLKSKSGTNSAIEIHQYL